MKNTPDNVVLAAFTEGEVSRLTGISPSQLRYWDRTSFFSPSFKSNDSPILSRMYSFRDLVCLQILNAIRNKSKVPLPHLREVKARLAHLGDDLWAKTTLYVLKEEVVFHNPETQDREVVTTGQKVLEIPLAVMRAEMAARVQSMRKRDLDRFGKIERTKAVVQNQPVISGTRIQVSSVRAFHEAGYTVEQIIDEYPTLSEEDVKAALAYGKAA